MRSVDDNFQQWAQCRGASGHDAGTGFGCAPQGDVDGMPEKVAGLKDTADVFEAYHGADCAADAC